MERKNNDPNSAEETRELYRKIRERIAKSLEVFNRYPSEQTGYRVMDEILYGYMFNAKCFISAYLDSEKDDFGMKTVYCNERSGDAYIMYTSADEVHKSKDPFMILTYRDAIRKAAANSNIVGFHINPSSDPASPRLFMSRQNMEMIVKTGEDQISRFGSELKEALEKYPDDVFSDKKPAAEKDEEILKMDNISASEKAEEQNKEKGFNRFRLDSALEQFYENPCQENFFQICEELVHAIYFNITAICPIELKEPGMNYKLFPTPDYGYAYIVYTSFDKNPEMKEHGGYVFVPWRTILLQAAKDLNNTGIVINPYSGHQAYVWVSSVYIRKIIQRAAMIMEDALKTFGKESEKETQSSPLTSEKMDDLEDFSVDDLSNIDLADL